MEELVYGPFLEIWKPIKEYEGLYEISNYGRVKSIYYNNDRIRKSSAYGKYRNHLNIVLCKNKIKKTYKIHQLVGQYIPNPFNLSDINHKDGDGFNNFHLNLEWVTSRENNCHKFKNLITSSKYTGVHHDKSRNKWSSMIHHNNKLKRLGRFNSEIEAYEARCNYEKENNILNKYL